MSFVMTIASTTFKFSITFVHFHCLRKNGYGLKGKFLTR